MEFKILYITVSKDYAEYYPECVVSVEEETGIILSILKDNFDMQKKIDFPDSGFPDPIPVCYDIDDDYQKMHIKAHISFTKITVGEMESFFVLAIGAYKKELEQYQLVAKYQSIVTKVKEKKDGTSTHSKTNKK